MKTVLLIPAGIGIAHTGRLVMIARELRKNNVRVLFGAGSDAIPLLKKENFDYLELPEFPKSIYNKKLKHNNLFVYSREIIEKFVLAELDCYNKVKPDAVVYDMRVTARISAEIAGIPVVSITNINLTPYYDFSKVKFTVNTLLEKYIPENMLGLINRKYGIEFVRRLGPIVFQAVLIMEMIKLSPILIKLGYKIKKDPYQLILGDLTLLSDIPEYRPVTKLPEAVKMIGPIFWDGGNKFPILTDKFRNSNEIIYVTAGGTGDKNLFIKILGYLAGLNQIIVATTGNTLKANEVKIKRKNLLVTDYLPGEYILPKSSLAIFPGGNATCYQVLSFGVPQILTPLHIDQEDNANQLERLGSGKIIPINKLDRKLLLKTIEDINKDYSYKENAEKLKNILRKYNGPKTAADNIQEFLQ